MAGAAHETWVLRWPPRPAAAVRLFCFPYAGGSAALYRSWSDALPALDVCAVELPGHGARRAEPPAPDLAALVDALAGGLAPLLDRPFALFGFSFGALVAFELARRLRRERRPEPVALVACSFPAPQATPPLPGPETSDDELLAFLGSLAAGPGELGFRLDDPELLAFWLPVLRGDLRLYASYRYVDEPPLDCPLAVFGGSADPLLRAADLGRWEEQTTAAFWLQLLPTGHYFLHSHRALLLRLVAKQLAAIAPGAASAAEERDT